jgi:formate hydrogenlyase regulatory protein HycA
VPHPDLIPISYEPESQTSHIGTFKGGLFMGDVVGDPEWFVDGQQFTVTVMLHVFDEDGAYVRTEFRPGISDEDAAWSRLESMIEELGDPVLTDIAIRLFEIEAHGRSWGLTDRGPDSDWVDLSPQDLGFHAPWNGGYST